MRRILLAIVALAALLLGIIGVLGFVGATPANADDIPPPVFPTGLPSPSQVGNDSGNTKSTPGPTYKVTPGSAGTALPKPESAQVRDARKALNRLNTQVGPKIQVDPPTAATSAGRAKARAGTDWWLVGSGLFLLLVVSDAWRVNRSGARHRLPVR